MLRLQNATLIDGTTVDVEVAGERITAVTPVPAATAVSGRGPASDDARVIDLSGSLLTSAFAEPHAHLDKALTADLVPNPAGDLGGAIDAWLAYRQTISKADYIERATAAAMLSVANGCTAIRTHVDIGLDIGTAGVEALLEVKAALASVVQIQLVGLVAGVTSSSGPEVMALLRDALDMGLDVVGGVPHIEGDPAATIDRLLELAAEFGRDVDLHADENLEPSSADLETVAARVLSTGFAHRVTASHCVALGMKPAAEQQRISELAAEAGVGIVTLPQTNLYLQARDHTVAQPRGLTALGALAEAGVTVAAGGDNLRDPFCIVGRADPMETAALLVMAGHLSADAAYEQVSDRARTVMGLEPVVIQPGGLADLVAIPVGGRREAIAAAPTGRVVIARGTVIHDGRANP